MLLIGFIYSGRMIDIINQRFQIRVRKNEKNYVENVVPENELCTR